MRAPEAAVRCGVAFVGKQQRADGSFAAFLSTAPGDFANATPLRTIFLDTFILAALSTVDAARLAPIKGRIAAFLLTQKGADWSFNYWDRASREYHDQSYPDDMDDTFCALAALWLHDPSALDGGTLAAAAHLLIATEKTAGGPYRTWLTQAKTRERWSDVDLTVNANIGWFLASQGVSVPGVTALVDRAIRSNRYVSAYYPDDTITLYCIARWYNGKYRSRLLAALRARLAATGSVSQLRTALLVSSLLRLGAGLDDCAASIARLLAAQHSDGSWPASAFCLDSVHGSTVRYVGSPTLTTAMCLETLALYTRAMPSAKPSERDTTYQGVVEHARQLIADITQPDLRRSIGKALRQVLASGNERQVVLLPYLIANATGVQAPAAVLQQLATANLFGWAAYTVCDDFLDGEGRPALLPGAVACLHRLHLALHATLPDNRTFHKEIEHVLDRIDAANAWEIAHCRGVIRSGKLYIKKLPRYGDHWQLADRSLGHTIAGLGVLYAAGVDGDDSRFIALRSFFKHYLIARQLNDDAHDWEDDLQRGHINAAGVLIVQHWLEQAGGSLSSGIPLEAGREALQSSMWEYAIDQVSLRIHRHTAAARRAIYKTGFDASAFEAMLAPLDMAVREALQTRQKTLDFLANL